MNSYNVAAGQAGLMRATTAFQSSLRIRLPPARSHEATRIRRDRPSGSKIREVANAGSAARRAAFWFGESDEPTPEFVREPLHRSRRRDLLLAQPRAAELREAIARYTSGCTARRGARRRHLLGRQRADDRDAGAGRRRRRGGRRRAGLAQPAGAAGDPRRRRERCPAVATAPGGSISALLAVTGARACCSSTRRTTRPAGR